MKRQWKRYFFLNQGHQMSILSSQQWNEKGFHCCKRYGFFLHQSIVVLNLCIPEISKVKREFQWYTCLHREIHDQAGFCYRQINPRHDRKRKAQRHISLLFNHVNNFSDNFICISYGGVILVDGFYFIGTVMRREIICIL